MTSSRMTVASHGVPVRAGFVLAVAVFLTRLPFVGTGYGTDSDTWKFASAIREIADTGRYTVSRLPGYPLMEWSCTPLAHLGAWAPNTLSAIAAAACAWLAARLFARHGVRDALLAGAAFVCVPAAWIAGTSSIDYLWALAFVLAAWLDAGDGRALRAGLWLGMAVGARMTSAPLVLPLVWLAWHAGEGPRLQRAVTLAVTGALVGLAWYVPSYLRYGWEFLSYSEIRGGQSSALQLVTGMTHPGSAGVAAPLIAGQATALLYGVLGCAAIALALLSMLWQRRDAARAGHIAWAPGWAIAAALVYEFVLYLRLPHDEGYLLPTVPLVLLVLAAGVTPARFRAVCMALLVSPFVLGIDIAPPKKGLSPAQRSAFELHLPVASETVVIEPLRGAVLRDLAKRQRMQSVAHDLVAWWPERPAVFRLAAGNLTSMMYYLFPVDPRTAPFARSYSPAELSASRAQGVPVYVLPDVVERMRMSEGGRSVEGLLPLPSPSGETR